jgi:hypothetical protein
LLNEAVFCLRWHQKFLWAFANLGRASFSLAFLARERRCSHEQPPPRAGLHLLIRVQQRWCRNIGENLANLYGLSSQSPGQGRRAAYSSTKLILWPQGAAARKSTKRREGSKANF